MKKHFIRAICILGVLVVLFSCCPLSAFAVDPVSASVIANSFAQAIAAYGASNGVAMTFDVGSTDGIGETVHELWSDFRAGTQDADDYDTLAAALFPNLYYKALSAAGTAAEAYTVGVSITSEYAEEFDNFYNWLLSGPAEMVQVDNQYYQFQSAQIGSSAIPLQVGTVTTGRFAGQPITKWPGGSQTWENLWSISYPVFTYTYGRDSYNVRVISRYSSGDFYTFVFPNGNYTGICSVTSSSGKSVYYVQNTNNGQYYNGSQSDLNIQSGNFYYAVYNFTGSTSASNFGVPSFDSVNAGLSYLQGFLSSPADYRDVVGVKAYTDAGIADIPDTADPNYDALGRAKDIPLDIPWDDSLYGDGTGALSDAQSGAIADEIAGVLETDSVIPLVEEAEAVNPRPDPDDDPSGDPDDYAVLGLEDVFPFCIPFDIYAFLSALAADPVPPSFTCTFDFPEALGGTQTLELDFDTPTFNQLAQLLRLLELLAFIVGLALLTRSMFIRG